MKRICILFVLIALASFGKAAPETIHIFEIKEIVLQAENEYDNPYTEVETWVQLTGPEFSRKIYGFWNGENEFVVRIAATKPGLWEWESHSNQDDNGLRDKSGEFTAVEWSEQEKDANPNRRGFIRATKNGRALEYADGHPFFMLGDTWWAASTWRFPLKGIEPDDDYIPNKDFSFENALHFRKKQNYNTIAIIASFPNWQEDIYPPSYMNEDSIGVRNAWENSGPNTGKDMHDELGNLPFEPWDKMPVIANFDRINPEFFKSLDKKMDYLNEQGFVVFLESVRRDHGPSWKKYFQWPESFARYVQYIVARYGVYNIIFAGIHLDAIMKHYSLTSDEFNEALTYHYNKYGGLPYGQPHTSCIARSTYHRFGHGDEAPWLTMHSVGNSKRDHRFYPLIEEIFNLNPPYPCANLEPYYPGWDSKWNNIVAGEEAAPNSERDNYFGRTQMYGSVLSGGLAGHVYGTGAFDGTTTGEPEGIRPYIWDALNYPSGAQLQHMGKFILSEGLLYQDCKPSRELLNPYKSKGAPEEGLDGWAFMLLSPNNDVAFTYFENKCEIPEVTGLNENSDYILEWFNPITGEWLEESLKGKTNKDGKLKLNQFPNGNYISKQDWALKIKEL